MSDTQIFEAGAQLAAKQVRDLLPAQPVDGVTLCIDGDDVWFQHGYWHVPVRPSAYPPRMMPLVDVLGEIEATLQVDYGLHIMVDLGDPEPVGAAEIEGDQSEMSTTIAA